MDKFERFHKFGFAVKALSRLTPELSDPARGTRGLQPRRSRRVRCSAWLGVCVVI